METPALPGFLLWVSISLASRMCLYVNQNVKLNHSNICFEVLSRDCKSFPFSFCRTALDRPFSSSHALSPPSSTWPSVSNHITVISRAHVAFIGLANSTNDKESSRVDEDK